MKEIYKNIYDLAKPFLQTRKNDVHIPISLEYAWRLLEKETGDPDVVVPAVILHDLGWWCLPEELQLKAFKPGNPDRKLNRVHEVEGVRMAGEILKKVRYDREKTKEILVIIDGHDSRITAVSLNDEIVKDADKLFRFSPRGFEIDSGRFGIEPEKYRILLGKQIDVWFFTLTAKRLAREAMEI